MNRSCDKKRLGILGGLGPLATSSFYCAILNRTSAKKDSDHLDVLITSIASTPDRTDFLLGKSSLSPLPFLLEAGRFLKLGGAEVLAIPCNTAHAFLGEIEGALGVPVLNMIEITAQRAKQSGKRDFALLATEGTVASGLYQKAFSSRGLIIHLPSPETQERVNSLIYQVLKQGKDLNQDSLSFLRHDPVFCLCDSLILGCTELSLISSLFSSALSSLSPLNSFPSSEGFSLIDPTLLLAEEAIVLCGGTLKMTDRTQNDFKRSEPINRKGYPL